MSEPDIPRNSSRKKAQVMRKRAKSSVTCQFPEDIDGAVVLQLAVHQAGYKVGEQSTKRFEERLENLGFHVGTKAEEYDPEKAEDCLYDRVCGDTMHLFVLSCLLFLCYCVQFVIVCVFIPMITKKELKGKIENVVDGKNEIEVWTHEHVAVKNVTCLNKAWSWEAAQLDDYGDYAETMKFLMYFPVHAGHFFGLVSILLFSCYLIIHFRRASQFVMLIWFTPACDMMTDFKSPSPMFIEVYGGMSTTVTQSIVFIIFLARLAAISCTGFWGIRFLALTENLTDFILNSVALVFILEIPEVLYKAFAPNDFQEIARQINNQLNELKVCVKPADKNPYDEEGNGIRVALLAVRFQRAISPLCAIGITILLFYGRHKLLETQHTIIQGALRSAGCDPDQLPPRGWL